MTRQVRFVLPAAMWFNGAHPGHRGPALFVSVRDGSSVLYEARGPGRSYVAVAEQTAVPRFRLTAATQIGATTVSGLLSCLPVRPPARVVPSYDALSGRPAPGNSRVVLDVEDRRCRVRLANQQQVGRVLVQQAADRQLWFVLCVTSCQVDLKRGAHRLRFCGEADVTVQLRSRPTIFRVAADGSRKPAFVQWEPAKRSAPKKATANR